MAQYYVYILANWDDSVVYTGVTNDLERRLYEHRNHLLNGFSNRYNVDKLVYFEYTSDIEAAIAREKQIKSWSRKRKNELVNSRNPQWRDLSKDWEA